MAPLWRARRWRSRTPAVVRDQFRQRDKSLLLLLFTTPSSDQAV
jgi:hypothetical protein